MRLRSDDRKLMTQGFVHAAPTSSRRNSRQGCETEPLKCELLRTLKTLSRFTAHSFIVVRWLRNSILYEINIAELEKANRDDVVP